MPLRRRADGAGPRPPLPQGGSAGNRPRRSLLWARSRPASRRASITKTEHEAMKTEQGGGLVEHGLCTRIPGDPCDHLGGPGCLPTWCPLGPPTTCGTGGGTITCCLTSTVGF